MQAKFDFYEVVKVVSDMEAYHEINGMEGVILGMSENNFGEWGYAVDILEIDDGWSIPESELFSLGGKMKREDIYTGQSIKISVDPETGKGSISDKGH